jgi:hypothetical protein
MGGAMLELHQTLGFCLCENHARRKLARKGREQSAKFGREVSEIKIKIRIKIMIGRRERSGERTDGKIKIKIRIKIRRRERSG